MNAAATVRKPLGILAAIGLLSGGAAPVAQATPTDDFLRQVRANGIGGNAPDGAVIQDAKEVCDMLDYQEGAYQYLGESIKAFLPQPKLAEMMVEAGFSSANWTNFALGIVALHVAEV